MSQVSPSIVRGSRRWPMTSLLDVLKEADLRIGFTDEFRSMSSREVLSQAELQKRLLLSFYGLGTNTGLKRVSASDKHINYKDLLYVRRKFIQKDSLRRAIANVVNSICRVRRPDIWGAGARELQHVRLIPKSTAGTWQSETDDVPLPRS